MDNDTPETLMEAVIHFSQPNVAHDFLVQLRWPDGKVTCPRCKSEKVCAIPTRKTWECKACTTQKQFSVKTGTIFEESPLPLVKWLSAIWLIANAKNGVSSYEIHRSLGVTQKTGWFMLQRIRLAMQTGTFLKFKGQVEVDETFIGGKARNMHKRDKVRKLGEGGKGSCGKSIVMGLLERRKEGGGEVRVFHVQSQSVAELNSRVHEHVEAGSEVFSDGLDAYRNLKPAFLHAFVDHAERYVDGQVHTNGLENFWALLKRSLMGTYVSVEPFHLFRYLDEQVFRFNKRGLNDGERFMKLIANITGKRLMYSQLTGKTGVAERPA
jgi:transposase-like protein